MFGFLAILGKLKSKWWYDPNERLFLNASHKKQGSPKSTTPSTIVIQAPEDHYILALYHQVVAGLQKKGSFKIIAAWPNIFFLKQESGLLFPVRIVYSNLNAFFKRRKWITLFKSIGADTIWFIDKVGLQHKARNLITAFTLWKKLKTREDLLNLSLEGIYCGDLIYDTYLRYQIRPTVSVNDPSLIYYLFKCLCVIESSKAFLRENPITHYFTSYSTYIHHGIPARIFLQSGVTVFSSGNLQQRFKKLTSEDYFHTARHRNYRQQFEELDDKPAKLNIAKDSLSLRFQGGVDTATFYMKKSAFQPEANALSSRFDGVVYLHDFYDSPHIYSSMLFPDFYQWTIHTLELIASKNLNVGIKPHPNQTPESKRDINELKSKYPSIQWIDQNVSNLSIINSGIKFVISVYGTVLHEFAFHGINAICAGDNPHTSFSFVHFPRTIEAYDAMVQNSNTLKLPEDYKDQVAVFYYMHNLNDKEDYEVDENIFTGFNIINGSSELLTRLK